MARLEDVLRTALVGNTTVAGMVGGRIYPGILPEAAIYPAIRYTRISTNRTDSRPMSGGSRHARTRVQYDCYARTANASWDLAKAVFDALDGWTGTNGDIRVGASSPEEQVDGSEPLLRNSNEPPNVGDVIYWRTVDVLAGYTHS